MQNTWFFPITWIIRNNWDFLNTGLTLAITLSKGVQNFWKNGCMIYYFKKSNYTIQDAKICKTVITDLLEEQ